MLIILGGLPGTGKSSIAKHLAKKLGATFLRIDSIEEGIRSCELIEGELGPVGYVAAYRLAQDNLKLGQTVIADSVNPIEVTRSAWRNVAKELEKDYLEVEFICSDQEEHRRRIETRVVDVPDLVLPTWKDVQNREYEDWHSAIKFDTSIYSIEKCCSLIISEIEGKTNTREDTSGACLDRLSNKPK